MSDEYPVGDYDKLEAERNKLKKTQERMINVINKIEQRAGDIFIREQINGKWGNFSLVDLPSDLAIKHTCRFIRMALEVVE